MAHVTPIIRVFFSSTFADFQPERNALQARVFPDMRRYCLERGARFLPMDLRWGIPDAAGVEQYVVRACLDEIARCQSASPHFNFVAMIGDRYGSLLIPETIGVDDFGPLLRALGQGERDFVAGWYQLDTNSVPPVYVLKPRGGDRAAWERARARLQAALSAASQRARVSDETRRACTTSVTEQEIEKGVFARPDLARPLLVRRVARGGRAPEGYREEVAESRRKLERLDQRLRRAFGADYLSYQTDTAAAVASADGALDGFVALMRDQLTRRIDEAMAREARVSHDVRDWSFARDRLKRLQPRAEAEERLRAYFAAPATTAMVVSGESGIGKTTLLLAATDHARADHPGRFELAYFTGGSTAIGSVADLIADIERQMLAEYPDAADTAPEKRTVIGSSPAEREARLPEFLARATAERPLHLIVDALDQLSGGDVTRWIPRALPPHVWLLVSILPADARLAQELQRLRDLLPGEALLEVGPLPLQQGAALLDAWLGDYGRTLTPEQRAAVLRYYAAHPNPLGLRVIVEMARRWPSTPAPTPELADSLRGLIEQSLEQLEQPARHSALLAQTSLGLIASGKQGLTEDETLGVISQHPETVRAITAADSYAPDARELPAVLWARLYGDLEWALSERDVDRARVLTFYHRQVREAVEARYLNDRTRAEWSDWLAQYFDRGAGQTPYLVNTREQPRAVVNERMVGELLYHQARSPAPIAAKRTLLDGEFLQARVQVATTAAALEDLDSALLADPDIRLLSDVLELGQPVLDALPQELPNQVWGRAPELYHKMRRWAAWEDPHLRLDSPTLRRPATDGVAEAGHTRSVIMGVFSPRGDRVVSASSDKTLRVWSRPGPQEPQENWPSVVLRGHTQPVRCCAVDPSGTWIASAADDMTVRLWDMEGRSLAVWDSRDRGHTGHTGGARWVVFSPDGGWLASGGADRAIHLYRRVDGGDEPYVFDRALTGHSGAINRCVFSPDSRLLASGAEDGTARVWDVRDGAGAREAITLDGGPDPKTGRPDPVSACLFVAGGAALVTGSASGALRVWSSPFAGGRSVALAGHGARIHDIAPHPVEGGVVASASEDNWLRVWDTASGRELASLNPRSAGVRACGFTADGGTLVAATWGNKGFIWDWRTIASPAALEGHSFGINWIALAPDGALAVTASDDKTLRAWDLRTRGLSAILGEAVDIIRSCAISPDGEYSLHGTADGWVTLESVEGQAVLQRWRAHEQCVRGVAFSPDGATVLSGSEDGTLQTWRRGGGALDTYRAHLSHVRCCAFSPDGAEFLSGGGKDSTDHTMRLWQVDQPEKEPQAFTGWANLVIDCLFSPDGQTVYGASYDNTIRAWRRGSPEERLIYRDPARDTGLIRAMALNPDGTRLAFAHKGGQIVVLDLVGGRPPLIIQAHTRYTNTCRFSADGRYVLSCASDGAITAWDLGTAASDGAALVFTWRGASDTLVCMAFDSRRWRICVAENEVLHTLTVVNLPARGSAGGAAEASGPSQLSRTPPAPAAPKRRWWQE